MSRRAAAVTVLFSRQIEDPAQALLWHNVAIIEHVKKTRSLCSDVFESTCPNINLQRLQSFRDSKRIGSFSVES